MIRNICIMICIVAASLAHAESNVSIEQPVKAQLGELMFINIGLRAQLEAANTRIKQLEQQLEAANAKIKQSEPSSK